MDILRGWRRRNILLSLIVFSLTAWSLFQVYTIVRLYQAGTQPFPIAPPAVSRADEICNGTVAAPKNIAIIGAGAAGSSAAYHLRRFASPCQPLNITVYERAHYIGGRSTTVDLYDDSAEPTELGASIFVEVNHILVSTAAELGLRERPASRRPPQHAADAELGVWDGTAFHFVVPRDEPSWRLAARLLWQYGTAPLQVQAAMRRVVDRFLSLYTAPLFPFTSLTAAAAEAGLADVTAQTGAAYLQGHGVGGAYATDIVQASTRVNYAQDLDRVHALEAMVCMAASGGPRALQGGNWRLFTAMLAASDAHVRLETAVQTVERRPDGQFALQTNVSATPHVADAVILAAPWAAADIAWHPSPARPPGPVDYVALHVTLFATRYRLRPSYFGLAPDEPAPATILTTRPSAGVPPPFFSISVLRATVNAKASPPRPELAYKIFSAAPLNVTFLRSILDVPDSDDDHVTDADLLSWSHHKLWNAYPYLPPRTTFDGPALWYGAPKSDAENREFLQQQEQQRVLGKTAPAPEKRHQDGDGLWYTSGIEPFISTMETSALMGRNVAALAVRWLAGDFVDGAPVPSRGSTARTEL